MSIIKLLLCHKAWDGLYAVIVTGTVVTYGLKMAS